MKFFLIFFCGVIFANSPQNLTFDNFNPLSYINQIRLDSDLFAFSENENLKISSQNHAKYLIANDYEGHDEKAGLSNYTGKNPSQRAIFAGLKTTYVLENISFNKTYETAIDSLFSAIYHRFAFLNFNVDEIGFSNFANDKKSAFVFNMTNSKLNDFCKNPQNLNENGYYILKICEDDKIKIFQKLYDDILLINKNDFVVFPNKTPQIPYFANEIPDPLPMCEISANPVSIEFNKFLNIKMKNFQVFDGNKALKEITIMDKNNDPNGIFKKNQFAFFPLEVLDFDKTYKAVFEYEENEKNKKIEWEFKTKSPKNPFFVVFDETKFKILPDQDYEIFFKPKDCNDLIKNFNFKFKNIDKPLVENVGPNLVLINLHGIKGGFVEFNVNGRKVKFILSKSSKDEIDRKNVVLISAFSFAFLLFCFQKFRK